MASIKTKLRAGLEAAIAVLNDENGRGGKVQLARRLKVTPASISQWDSVPIGRVAAVEKITGVDRTVLRPDHYPPTARAA